LIDIDDSKLSLSNVAMI